MSDTRVATRPYIIGPASTSFVVPAASVFVGAGDIVAGADMWWGLRAYNAAYATGSNPAIDITDQAGANPLTVNILSTGFLDVASIVAWVAAHSVTTIHISQIYDQTGHSLHMLQATDANRPFLLLPPVAGFGTGLAVISINPGINQTMATAGNMVTAQPNSVSAVSQPSANNTIAALLNGAGNGFPQITYDGSTNIAINANTAPLTISAPSGQSYALQGLMNGASSTLLVNGTSAGPTNIGTQGWTAAPIGMGVGGGAGGAIFAGEFGVWPGDQSASFSALAANQRSLAYGWNF